MDDPTSVRTMMIEGASADELRKAFGLPIMTLLSRMLRAALIPAPGHTFFAPDWSSIEGRVAPWLTDSPAGYLKLEVYCHSDDDPDADDVYTDTARGLFPMGTEIEDKERQTGKVTELSMQYQGGGNALRRMGLNYGVYFSIEEAEAIKKQWRENNPWCVNMWVRCEDAAFKAIKYPGNTFEAGRLSYICLEEVLNFPKVLFCELPSGRFLTYPDIRIEMKPAPWDETKLIQQLTALHSTWTPKATETEWPRSSLYGGILFQHGCQATAADCMRWLLREPAYVVAHVHDEGLYELPIVEDFHEQTRDDVLVDMSAGPLWAAGLPLVADGEFLERYGK
jgi:DNA polymerase